MQTKLDTFTKKRACSAEQVGAISDRNAAMIIKNLRPINIVSGHGVQDITYRLIHISLTQKIS